MGRVIGIIIEIYIKQKIFYLSKKFVVKRFQWTHKRKLISSISARLQHLSFSFKNDIYFNINYIVWISFLLHFILSSLVSSFMFGRVPEASLWLGPFAQCYLCFLLEPLCSLQGGEAFYLKSLSADFSS